MSFEIGEITGDYEIVGVLGSGGMGKVYKVRNTLSDRFDAMKVLLPDLTNNTELGDRFLREIKVQARLNHPNIASLHTALRLNNQLLMIMELVEGNNLEREIHNGAIPYQDAETYLIQVLSALEYAHKHGVIHRDIKPANIILMPSGRVKLMDFGIARVAAERSLTKTGIAMGSLFYMSPEQIHGDTPDARSDIYALGVTFYEVLTGKKPIDGDSDYSIMTAHLQYVPINPSELNPKVPSALAEVILKALAKSPDHRFQTAEEFLAAVIEAKQNPGSFYHADAKTVLSRPVTVPRQVLQSPPADPVSAPRKVRPAVWAAVAAAVLLAGAGISRFTGNQSSPSTPPTLQQAAPSEAAQAPGAPVSQPKPEEPATSAPAPVVTIASNEKAKPVQQIQDKPKGQIPAAVAPPTLVAQQAAPVPATNFPVVVQQPAPGPATQSAPAATAPKDPRPIVQEDAAQAAARAEQLAWDAVTGTKDAKALRAFRAQFPSGAHASHAAAELEALDREANIQSLLATLSSYQAAYDNRDTDAIRAVWPSLGRDDLGKIDGFFKATKSAKMTLQPLGTPKLSGDTATIVCRRSITAQMKDGTRQRPVEQNVTVRMTKSGAAWVIIALE